MTTHISASSNSVWRVNLFGGPALVDRYGAEIRRFRSQKVRALLGYLALNLGIACSRELLSELLWPDEEPQVVANRFRVALASLRRQLEPKDVAFGIVLDVSEPRMVKLRSEFVSCDYIDFYSFWRSGRRDEAMQLVNGPLLPDIYDDWALEAQADFENLTQINPLSLLRLKPPNAPEENSEHNPESTTDITRPYRNVLPLFLTRFFGRRAEMDCIRKLMQDARLVTVTGIGGIGKTRIVCEVANSEKEPYLFVSLADVDSVCKLDTAIASAISKEGPVGETPTGPVEKMLQESCRRLLIMDNAEHLVEGVSVAAMRLLAAVEGLRFLVTSRQALGVPGEAVVALSPLDVPSLADEAERDLASYTSISLFVDRARNARPDFALNARNQAAVAEICARLDGIPLAIELAAARISLQTPGQIAHMLRQDLTSLSSNSRGLSERHRSLRSVIQTSILLLPSDVREFLLRLAMLPNGWTLETARVVTACDRADEYLDYLVRSSLVERREQAITGAIRYSFLGTVRQFTLKYVESGRAAQIWDEQGSLAVNGGWAAQTWDEPGNLVVNGSFEHDAEDDRWYKTEGGMYAYPFIVPHGWKADGSCNVNAPNFNAFYSGPPHGANTAVVGDHFHAGKLYQDLNVCLKAGDTIVASALVGNRMMYEGSGRVLIETVSGNVLANSGEVMAEPGEFKRVRLSYTVQQDCPHLGKQIRIVLERPSGNQANFDCISVTVASDSDSGQ